MAVGTATANTVSFLSGKQSVETEILSVCRVVCRTLNAAIQHNTYVFPAVLIVIEILCNTDFVPPTDEGLHGVIHHMMNL